MSYMVTKSMNLVKILASCALGAFALSCENNCRTLLHDGDLVFQVSTSTQSRAIQLATGSKYSHVGIVYVIQDQPFVLEAIKTVRLTPFDDWKDKGVGGHFVAKRLQDAGSILTIPTLKEMKHMGASFLGRDYDGFFEWSDDKLYCSELVWKIYHSTTGLRIGELQRLSELRIDDPLVKDKLRERYISGIPYDELVISPGAMFDSRLLEAVCSD